MKFHLKIFFFEKSKKSKTIKKSEKGKTMKTSKNPEKTNEQKHRPRVCVCGSTFNNGRTRAHVSNTAPASVQSSSQRVGALSLVPSCLGVIGSPQWVPARHPRYTGARSAGRPWVAQPHEHAHATQVTDTRVLNTGGAQHKLGCGVKVRGTEALVFPFPFFLLFFRFFSPFFPPFFLFSFPQFYTGFPLFFSLLSSFFSFLFSFLLSLFSLFLSPFSFLPPSPPPLSSSSPPVSSCLPPVVLSSFLPFFLSSFSPPPQKMWELLSAGRADVALENV